MVGMTRPLRTLVFGYGNAAQRFHVPAFRELPGRYRIVAVVDPSPENRAQAVDDFGLSAEVVVGALDRIDADELGLEVLDICSPPDIRTEPISWAVDRRLHVVCEKPIALSSAEARKLLEAAAGSDRQLTLMHNWVHFPEYAALLALVAEGAIGVPEHLAIELLGFPDVQGSAGYLPDWRKRHVGGGGIFMDLMHVNYLAERLLGGPIHRVDALTSARGSSAEVEDFISCRVETAGASATITLSWRPGPARVVLSGSSGWASVRYRADDLQRGVESLQVVGQGSARVVEIGEFEVGHCAVLLGVADAVDRGDARDGSAEESLRALEVVLGAYRSAVTGRSVGLPLDPDDPVALRGIGGLAAVAVDPTAAAVRAGLYGT